jgi:hypothetical protein
MTIELLVFAFISATILLNAILAAFAKDDTKAIKYLLWAILLVIANYGVLNS